MFFNRSEFQNLLLVMGLKDADYVGGGSFARVYKTAYNTVVKFTTDKAYKAYIDAFKGTSNMYAPKVINDFGVIGCMKKGDTIFAIELPIYTSLEDLGCTSPYNKVLDFNIMYNLDSKLYHADQFWGMYNEILSLFPSDCTKFDADHFADWAEKVNGLMMQDGRIKPDLHCGNVMLNLNTNCIVFTDPVVYKGAEEIDSYRYNNGECAKFEDMFNLEHIKNQLRVVERFAPSIDATVYIGKRKSLLEKGLSTKDNLAQLILEA